MEIKASAAGCGVQEGRAGGRSGRNLGGRIDGKWSFFQVSEAVTSGLDRTEAESEVISHLPHLFLLVTLLGWKSFYSAILVFMNLVQCHSFFFFFFN